MTKSDIPLEFMDDQARSVVVAANPMSGASDSAAIVASLVERLSNAGFEPESISEIDAIRVRASELRSAGKLKAVVAAGGDGTVSLLANQLEANTPIAVLPLGTENLLAKFLGITQSVDQVTEMIVSGKTEKLDTGRANGKQFLVMASCGFDADVVSRLHASRKGHINHWSYAVPILSAIRLYKYPKMRITVDDGRESWTTRWAFVFNVPRYAMNLPIVSDADATDGMLDVCTFRVRSFMQGFAALGAVLLRRHREWSETRLTRFEKLLIEADQPVPYQLDGDPGGMLPLEISVAPASLTVLVPQDWPT